MTDDSEPDVIALDTYNITMQDQCSASYNIIMWECMHGVVYYHPERFREYI